MAHLFNRLKLKELSKVPVRYRNGPDHWATIRKKKTPKDKALEHFDEFYGSVYGKGWESIRTALLMEHNKHIAVVNNFSDTDRIRSELESQGAININAIYNTFKENMNEVAQSKKHKKQKKYSNTDDRMNSILSNVELSKIQSIYPSDCEQVPKKLTTEEDEVDKTCKPLEPMQLKSIEDDLNRISLDVSRIIEPSTAATALYEYIPATKIKGLDDWVLESEYYNYYTKGANFSVQVEKETVLPFPEHLHAYTYESGNKTRFRSPKIGTTGVLDYYLFDGGSILPVLALDLQPGDTVLDMCAAPGGKALTILQTLMPRLMVANDVQPSRVKRINNILKQYVADIGQWDNILFVTEQDARSIEDKDIYNKILVDVPCTTDRHVLHADDNNLFKPSRIKERLRIPELQTEILTNALKLISVGGTVVYSTCSLSPVQNDGVVQVALRKAWEETDSILVVKNLTTALQPLSCLYKFSNIGSKYGNTVIPTVNCNWGPIYFCKIVRIR